MSRLEPIGVQEFGPLTIGAVYGRADLHRRFGGNNTAGIVPSLKEPIVLLFHTLEPSNQFYEDGFDESGVYLYAGQGVIGNMEWNAANRALRDHRVSGRSLLFFERYRRQGGLWQFRYQMVCIGVREQRRRDRAGEERLAFMFELLPMSDVQAGFDCSDSVGDLGSLRRMTVEPSTPPGTAKESVLVYRSRSEAIARYARLRSAGVCEACGQPAPFATSSGLPYLEVHYLRRQVDRGPAEPHDVAAVCPNCHRRCHYSRDASDFNNFVSERIREKERT